MTPPDDPLRALDAAWEALADAVRACLGNGDAAAEHVAAHRPLIEAALQQPARSEGLDYEALYRQHREVCHNANPDAVIAHLHRAYDELSKGATVTTLREALNSLRRKDMPDGPCWCSVEPSQNNGNFHERKCRQARLALQQPARSEGLDVASQHVIEEAIEDIRADRPVRAGVRHRTIGILTEALDR